MKRIISFLAVVALGLGFSGCAPKWDTPLANDPKFKPGVSEFTFPKLNVEAKAEIGQSLYEKARGVRSLDVKLLKRAKAKVNWALWVDSQGVPYQAPLQENLAAKIPKFKEGKLLSINNKNNGLCYTQWVCLTDLNNDGNFTHFSAQGNISFHKLDEPTPYKTTSSIALLGQDSFRYVALYQGKIGNKIRISFREFYKSMARPAFTQDIDYELESDGTALVGFKGLRIQVLKATNLDITYKVIKDYN